jgi:hypothetical protein
MDQLPADTLTRNEPPEVGGFSCITEANCLSGASQPSLVMLMPRISSSCAARPRHPPKYSRQSSTTVGLGKLNADVLLIGHSLGGSVLLKYLAEGTDPRPIAGLFLVAVPCWGKRDWELEYTLPEDFASHLPPISQIFMYHSRHDEVVPFSHLRRYQEQLPQATIRELDGKEHSFTRGLPELVRDLKSL